MSESETIECPRCGRESGGNFCSHCGGALGGVHCNQCGSKAEPGARFCNECGAPIAAAAGRGAAGVGAGRVAAGPGTGAGATARGGAWSAAAGEDDGGNQTAWWVAGGLFLALILAVVIPPIQRAQEDAAGAGAGQNAPFAGGGAGGAAVPGVASTDISSMTPIQAADRLYERVMLAASAGDSAQVQMFLPMSIAAYERAQPLNADGLFHLSVLQRTALQAEDALTTAEEALAAHPDHLLNLAAAAGAAADLGRDERARELYGRMLEVWDAEMAKELEEYEAHANMLPDLRAEAEAYLGG